MGIAAACKKFTSIQVLPCLSSRPSFVGKCKSMRNLLLLLLVSGLHLQAMATVHTVSNLPGTLAQFNTIQDAVNAAASGDSIYVQGSPVLYAGFSLTDKKLAIFGPGFAPQQEISLTARVNGATIRNTSAAGSSNGSEFHGLLFAGVVTIADNMVGNEAVNNLSFIRCQFNTVVNVGSAAIGSMTNYLFESNYFNNSGLQGSSSTSYSNFIIRNNVFRNALNSRVISSFLNVVNVLVDHNLFYTSNSSLNVFGVGNVSGCSFLTVTNNIFVKSDASTLVSSTFNNNITFNTPNNTPWGINNNADGGGNVANQDPQLGDATAVNSGTDNPLLNFKIAAGPANNAGSDGKDMGLLFDDTGSANWDNARNARLPRVTRMNITTPTVAPGGSLQVNLEAKVSN